MYYEEETFSQKYAVELVRDSKGDRFYINLMSFSVPFGSMEIGIEPEGGDVAIHYVQVMEGGQRLLLDGSGTCLIVESLLNGQQVTLYLAKRQATLMPANFSLCL